MLGQHCEQAEDVLFEVKIPNGSRPSAKVISAAFCSTERLMGDLLVNAASSIGLQALFIDTSYDHRMQHYIESYAVLMYL